MVDEIVRRVIARMADQAVRETVLDVAERLVREEIERIKRGDTASRSPLVRYHQRLCLLAST